MLENRTRDFLYEYTDAPNSKLARLVDRVQQLGSFIYLEDIVGYYSEWKNETFTMNIRGEIIEANVWLPTVLRPAREEEKKKYTGVNVRIRQ